MLRQAQGPVFLREEAAWHSCVLNLTLFQSLIQDESVQAKHGKFAELSLKSLGRPILLSTTIQVKDL